MKKLFTLLFLVLQFAGFAQSTEELKLTQTVKEFHQAIRTKNTISINQQTDKAMIYGHSDGWVENKNEFIKNLETGNIRYQRITEDSITITINGNLANVRFISDISAANKDEEYKNYHLKVLQVWVKKSNRWVLFARQSVKIS